MANTLTWTMAFLMGFTGSLHCAGMCGPIIWIMPFNAYNGIMRFVALTIYHFSRVTVYALLALLLHSFREFFDPKVQQYISIGLGISLLIIGIISFMPSQSFAIKLPWSGFVKKQLGKTVGKSGLAALAIAGFLNGLLPCGLVYMALSASFAVHSAVQASLLMYVFGIGTFPMLFGISLLQSRLAIGRVGAFKRFAPVVVFFFGCLLLLRGMNLGIPYLSPEVVITKHEIKSCCSQNKK